MHNKGNHKQNEKTTYRMGQNICKDETDKGLIFKKCKQLKQLTIKKQPSQKVGRRSKETFLQRGHTNGQQAHEKMLNIINYQRKANQNYSEVSPHTGQTGHHQKVYK